MKFLLCFGCMYTNLQLTLDETQKTLRKKLTEFYTFNLN